MVVLFLGQAFGQSFLQPDIHLFKQNLFYLETLNTKQKLYHKVSAHFSERFLIKGTGPWSGTWGGPGALSPLAASTHSGLCLQKIFRTTMLFQFVNVLLQVLVHKSHDLLQEEIGIAIYNMASVDFDGFFAAFLPEFLTGCDGVDANQKNVLGRNFKMDRVRREARLKGGWCGLREGQAAFLCGLYPGGSEAARAVPDDAALCLVEGYVLSPVLAAAALCFHLIRHWAQRWPWQPGCSVSASWYLLSPSSTPLTSCCFLVG